MSSLEATLHGYCLVVGVLALVVSLALLFKALSDIAVGVRRDSKRRKREAENDTSIGKG